MADFFQTGEIATLHRLRQRAIEDLEQEILEHSRSRPVTLVLPCHVQELDSSAFQGILEELRPVPYLADIVLGLDGADRADFRRASSMVEGLNPKPTILWNDGERIQGLLQELEEENIHPGQRGKGRNVWLCCGYALAKGETEVISLHDCDIRSYSREMLARLCYPTVSSRLDFSFCKGYYARVADQMYGRVTRLFVTPLIRSLVKTLGPNPFLTFLDSFRYLLAGEFSMSLDLARRNRVPADWGLEVGALAEVYRNCNARQVCQVDLGDDYEHKHQPLSPNDASKGLRRMSLDIAKTLLRTMGSIGVVLGRGVFPSLKASYLRTAQDFVERYAQDAALNGLPFHRHEEEQAVDTFARSIMEAGDQFLEDPLGAPLISNWNRVSSAVPSFLPRLLESVESDRKALY